MSDLRPLSEAERKLDFGALKSAFLTLSEIAPFGGSGRGDVVEYWRRKTYIALNRYAVGSRPADREVARPRDYETRLSSTAFPMSALPRIATTERTWQHVSNVPLADVKADTRII